MTDYFELHEIDIGDVQMRLFAQTLAGDVRTCFRALPANDIDTLEIFYQQLQLYTVLRLRNNHFHYREQSGVVVLPLRLLMF